MGVTQWLKIREARFRARSKGGDFQICLTHNMIMDARPVEAGEIKSVFVRRVGFDSKEAEIMHGVDPSKVDQSSENWR
jgi:hypothetical protein